MSQFDNVVFELLGESEGVRDWQGLQILATFDNDNNQPNITSSELTFTNEMGKKIIEHIDNGANGIGNGIFEGVDFKMWLNNPSTDVFDGILDLADDIEINRDKNQVKAKLLKLDGLNTFANISDSITMALLEQEDVFSSSDYVDIPYVKETPFDFISTAILVLSIYQTTKQLQDITREIADLAGDSGGEAAGSLSTGLVGAGIITFAKGAAKILYAAAMLYILIDMMDELLSLLYPAKKYHRGIKLKTIIEKGCSFAGYNYINSIPELDNLYLIPRKTTEGRKNIPNSDTGLPVTRGPLYTLGKCVGLVKDLFGAKVSISGDDVNIVPLINTGFWEKTSPYVTPDVKIDVEKYNTNELVPTKVYSFSVDDSDYWTLENYRGTSYEVKVMPNSYSDLRKVTMKGIEELQFPVSLGVRKNELSVLENTFKALAKVVDKLSKIFGSNPDYSGRIENRKGMLKMSSDLVNVPKLLRLNSQLLLPTDYKDNWSAKYLYENYLNHFSFVLNNYGQQYRIYEKIRMNATFQDFLDVVDNNIGEDAQGNRVKFESILYNFGGGYWEADYRVHQIYTRNLKETYIEPE